MKGNPKCYIKHVESLVNHHRLDTTLLGSVIFERTCQPYRFIPEDVRLHPNQVYPLLRREIAELLDIKWEHAPEPYKLHNALKDSDLL